MANKRGGQRKHWAELARTWAWYNEIQRRCGWTDYQLDHEFAWRDGHQPEKANDQRPRTFEWLRKSGRKPAGRDARWRNMKELVGAVERCPGFAGTRDLYDAMLWNLIQDETPRPDEVQKHVDDLLSANSLVRLPRERILDRQHPLPADFDEASVYDRCLGLALQKMNRYSGIALVWLLYLLTEPAHNWQFRAILESRADEMLDSFFADYLEKSHLLYYGFAIQALLATRMDLSAWRTGGYGNIETIGKWLIVPEVLVGKVTAAQLLSPFEKHVLFGQNGNTIKKSIPM